MEWGRRCHGPPPHPCDLPILRHSRWCSPEAGLALPEAGERSAFVPVSRPGLEFVSEYTIAIVAAVVALFPLQ